METTNLFHNRSLQEERPQKAISVDSEVKLSEEIFENYKSAREQWAIEARKWEDFRRGFQLTRKEIKELTDRNQPPIIVNVLESSVEQAKALLTSNKPRFTSTGREDSDTRTGKMFSDILTYVWDISDGNMRLKQAIDEYYVRGMGVLMAYVDPFADFGKGEVFITSDDSFNVYLSPNCTDPYGRDSEHIILEKLMSREQISISWPQFISKLKEARTSEQDNKPQSTLYNSAGLNRKITTQLHTTYQLLDRYTKIRYTDYSARRVDTIEEWIKTEEQYEAFLQEEAYAVVKGGELPQFITDIDGKETFSQLLQEYGPRLHQAYNQFNGQTEWVPGLEDEVEHKDDGYETVPGSSIIIEQITIADLIELGVITVEEFISTKVKRVMSIGGIKVYEGLMDISEYPIVTIMNHHNRTPYPLSDIYMVMDLQKQINKIESLIVAHASSSTNTKIFYPRGSIDKKQIERDWAKSGTAFFEYNAEIGKPEQMYPPPLPNELYKNKADKIAEVERTLGIYALQQGDAGQAPNTYKGTVALDEYGQRRIKSKKDDIEGALNVLAKVVIELIQNTYTERKVIRLLQPNNVAKELVINESIYDDLGNVTGKINDITVGKYDAVVLSGSMLPSNRWAQFDYYFQLYQTGAIDQVELLKKTEIVDVEGVLNRHSEKVQMQNYIAQLEEQVKNLQGDLQTATRESLHDKKRVEVEKFKTELNKLKSDAQATSELHKTMVGVEEDLHKERLKMDREVLKSKMKGPRNE